LYGAYLRDKGAIPATIFTAPSAQHPPASGARKKLSPQNSLLSF
jgi:hypothetical protein